MRSSLVAGLLLFLSTSVGAQGGAPPSTVRADAVRKETVQERKFVTGEIRAVHRSKVAAEEPGRIEKMPVREGQRVKQGDVLVEIHATRLDLEIAINEAEAAFALSSQAEAQARWNQSDRDLKSVQRLDEKGAANPKELDDAKTALDAAAARLEQAKRQVALERVRGELLAERRRDMTIRAPFDGVVLSRAKDLGEWVAEGEEVIELVSTEELEAWIAVPQRYLTALTTGDPTVVIDIHSTGQRIVAKSPRVIPNVDPSVRNFPVVVAIAADGLVPGVSISAWVPIGKESERLTVQKDAVLRGDTGAFIYLARALREGQPQSATMVPVNVLFAEGDRVIIEAAGIQPGELAIVEGNEGLYPMAPVAPFVKDAKEPKKP